MALETRRDVDAFLGALEGRGEAGAFDLEIARHTSAYVAGGSGAAAGHGGSRPAGGGDGDARAVTPLMRTGSPAEHARAFVAAWDLAQEQGLERVRAVLEWDLGRMEAHLLGMDSSAERLVELRRLAG